MTKAGEHLNEDQAYVSGRSEEKARNLIERAEAAGLEANEVITTSFGYIVPASILEEGEADSTEQANVLPDAAPHEAEKSPEAKAADEETEAAAKANAEDAAQADAEEAKPERKTKARKADTEEGK
jgi:hypothetical protein